MIEKKMKISRFYDFYGELLTKNQKKIVDMYYNEDYSLGEIGDILGISRQAVHDSLKRSEKLIIEYEEKLGLVERFNKHIDEYGKINSEVENIINKVNDNQTIRLLNDLKKYINGLTD